MIKQLSRPSDRAEEALETLYEELVESGRRSLPFSDPSYADFKEGMEELCFAELAQLHADEIQLTPQGREAARRVIRRHRLAERLMADVLAVREEQMEEAACGMEHSLREGVDEAVCTLLGHPQTCPHGKAIPPGECCTLAAEKAEKGVAALSRLRPNQGGRIAFVRTAESRKLHKLMAMGILPGKTIRLLQSFPSYVFSVGQSQFAIDEDMARSIFVRTEQG